MPKKQREVNLTKQYLVECGFYDSISILARAHRVGKSIYEDMKEHCVTFPMSTNSICLDNYVVKESETQYGFSFDRNLV